MLKQRCCTSRIRPPLPGVHGPLDCIARVAPRLRSLTLGTHLAEDLYNPPFLSPTATLPPSLTRMHINGLVAGLGPHLSQVGGAPCAGQMCRIWVA